MRQLSPGAWIIRNSCLSGESSLKLRLKYYTYATWTRALSFERSSRAEAAEEAEAAAKQASNLRKSTVTNGMQPKKCFAKSFLTDTRTRNAHTHLSTWRQTHSGHKGCPAHREAALAILFGGKMFLYDAPMTKTTTILTNEAHKRLKKLAQRARLTKRAREREREQDGMWESKRERRQVRDSYLVERAYCTCTTRQADGPWTELPPPLRAALLLFFTLSLPTLSFSTTAAATTIVAAVAATPTTVCTMCWFLWMEFLARHLDR